MKIPRIGVTGPDRGGLAAWIFTRRAIGLAGGEAVRITPDRPRSLGGLEGLVLGGGADVGPDDASVGETFERAKQSVDRGHSARSALLSAPLVFGLRRALESFRAQVPDPDRDRLERALLAEALERRLPILGICRGAQLINLSRGGTLFGDIAKFYVEAPNPRTVLPIKEVAIDDTSLLARLLGTCHTFVNALHHQAVDRLGEGLRVVAREPNGIVQAIEDPARPFLLGVQWHPEYLAEQAALFAGLVSAAQRA